MSIDCAALVTSSSQPSTVPRSPYFYRFTVLGRPTEGLTALRALLVNPPPLRRVICPPAGKTGASSSPTRPAQPARAAHAPGPRQRRAGMTRVSMSASPSASRRRSSCVCSGAEPPSSRHPDMSRLLDAAWGASVQPLFSSAALRIRDTRLPASLASEKSTLIRVPQSSRLWIHTVFTVYRTRSPYPKVNAGCRAVMGIPPGTGEAYPFATRQVTPTRHESLELSRLAAAQRRHAPPDRSGHANYRW